MLLITKLLLPLGIPRHRFEDNIRMCLIEISVNMTSWKVRLVALRRGNFADSV